MDRKELTWRLHRLGMKKEDLAKRMGMSASTVYQWGEVPGYAVALIETMEELARWKEARREVAPVVAPERKTNSGQFKKRGEK
jgi:uncharacterized protein YjcR